MTQVGAWLPRDGRAVPLDSTYTSDVAAGHDGTLCKEGRMEGWKECWIGEEAVRGTPELPLSLTLLPAVLPVRSSFRLSVVPSFLLSLLLRRLLLLRLPRGEPDDLDSRATGHVHCLDHILIEPVRSGLDEQELGGTLIVDGMDLGVQLVFGERLAVDGGACSVWQLEHDLAGRSLGRLGRVGRWYLDIERHAAQGLGDHEDDQQHQEHVDHGRDVDVRLHPTRGGPCGHCHLLLLLLVIIAEHDRLVRFGDRSHDPDA